MLRIQAMGSRVGKDQGWEGGGRPMRPGVGGERGEATAKRQQNWAKDPHCRRRLVGADANGLLVRRDTVSLLRRMPPHVTQPTRVTY